MRRCDLVLLALALVAASGGPAMSQGAGAPGFNVVARGELYAGVDYLKLSNPKVPVLAHVAHVAPDAPVDLRVVNAEDKITTGTGELETTSSMCRRVRCVVGINGDFHTAGTPNGGVIIDGRMLHSPDPGRAQLTVTADGRLVAGPLPWSGSVTGDGVQIAVAAVNGAPPADGLALYTPAFGPRTQPSGRTEVVVGGAAPAALNRPASLELRGVRTGAGPIPAGGAVLSADGAAAQQLRDLWARGQSGVPARVQVVLNSPVDAVVSLGVEPVVLRDGKRALPWRDPNLIYPRQPHTLVGWNRAGDVYLVAVDGRQPGSDGVTMAEAADFLLGLGATDAVNLDGGGGTTFVAGGAIWNRPSDNDPARPADYEERGGVNAFVVTARPGAPLPPASPPPPMSMAPAPPATAGAPGDATTARVGPAPSPSDGLDGSVFGPVTGVVGPLADGDLPPGPGSATRWASASSSGAALGSDPAGGGPPDLGKRPATGGPGDGERSPAGPRFSPTVLTRQIVDAAVGGNWSWKRSGLLATAAVAGALLGVRLKRRRRSRRRMSDR